MTLDNLRRVGKLKAHAADERELARLLESAGRALQDASAARAGGGALLDRGSSEAAPIGGMT